MTFELTDHVSGIGADEVALLVREAEAGFDLDGAVTEPNPHRIVVPDELMDAVVDRAERDGESPEEIVRRALASYLIPSPPAD